MPATPTLAACPTCGLVHELPPVAADELHRCTRCRSAIVAFDPRAAARSRSRAASLAFAALLLYPFAIALPIVTVTRLGQAKSTSILASSIDLIEAGELVVGLVIVLASIVIPLFKLSALLIISTTRDWLKREHAARTWRFVEHIGRWGMIDVMLASVMIALLKVKDLVTIDVGPGLFVFSACVLLSLAASAAFHPQALWSAN